jgi:hypothetical protein
MHLMPQNNIIFFLLLRYFKRINAGGLIQTEPWESSATTICNELRIFGQSLC